MLPGNLVPPEPSPAALPAPLSAPATKNLGQHIPCLACNYDLQGLAPDAICPECTFPARISRSEARRLPSPYLRALSWSAWLTLAPVVATLLGILSPIADGVVAWFSRVSIGSFLFHNAPLSLIPWAIGVRSLATLQPPNDTRPLTSRVRNRAFDIILTVVTAVFIVSILWLLYWSRPWTPPGASRDHPAWIPVMVCGQTLVVCQMLASIDIAARLASPRLRESARAVLVCSIPTSALGLGVAMDLEQALPSSMMLLKGLISMALIAGAIGCIAGLLGVCVSTFGALNHLRTLRKNLIRANQLAPATPNITTSTSDANQP